MPELVVVTGPPGSGKSVVARALADGCERSAVVAGDVFFGFVGRGLIAPWTPAAHAQNTVVVEAAAAAAGRLADVFTVCYDGVVGPWFLRQFLHAAGRDAAHYVVLLPDVEVCVRRVSTRTGHGFTDLPATRHMHAEFVAARIDPRHLVTTDAGPAEVVCEVRDRVANGTCRTGDTSGSTAH